MRMKISSLYSIINNMLSSLYVDDFDGGKNNDLEVLKLYRKASLEWRTETLIWENRNPTPGN